MIAQQTKIVIRIGNTNAGDPDTGEYTDSTMGEAITALRGSHPDPDVPGYHSGTMVYVTAVYERDIKDADSDDGRPHRYGDPVFGLDAEVYPARRRYDAWSGSEVNWGGLGSQTPETASLMAEILAYAARLARLANQVQCPRCAARSVSR